MKKIFFLKFLVLFFALSALTIEQSSCLTKKEAAAREPGPKAPVKKRIPSLPKFPRLKKKPPKVEKPKEKVVTPKPEEKPPKKGFLIRKKEEAEKLAVGRTVQVRELEKKLKEAKRSLKASKGDAEATAEWQKEIEKTETQIKRLKEETKKETRATLRKTIHDIFFPKESEAVTALKRDIKTAKTSLKEAKGDPVLKELESDQERGNWENHISKNDQNELAAALTNFEKAQRAYEDSEYADKTLEKKRDEAHEKHEKLVAALSTKGFDTLDEELNEKRKKIRTLESDLETAEKDLKDQQAKEEKEKAPQKRGIISALLARLKPKKPEEIRRIETDIESSKKLITNSKASLAKLDDIDPATPEGRKALLSEKELEELSEEEAMIRAGEIWEERREKIQGNIKTLVDSLRISETDLKDAQRRRSIAKRLKGMLPKRVPPTKTEADIRMDEAEEEAKAQTDRFIEDSGIDTTSKKFTDFLNELVEEPGPPKTKLAPSSLAPTPSKPRPLPARPTKPLPPLPSKPITKPIEEEVH